MALGGFSTLTPEQRGRCLLLGIDIITGSQERPGMWFITHIEDGLKVLVDKDNVIMKYTSADEALQDYILNKDKYKWV
jgi:hypothetical protein